MDIQLPENLGGVEEMSVVDDPARVSLFLCHNIYPPESGVEHPLLDVPAEERQVKNQRNPVAVDQEQEGQESVDGDFRDDVLVEAVAEVNRVDVVARKSRSALFFPYQSRQHRRRKPAIRRCGPATLSPSIPTRLCIPCQENAYHSKSLYMMVKNTCRNRLTAFMMTAKRYNHASPDILAALEVEETEEFLGDFGVSCRDTCRKGLEAGAQWSGCGGAVRNDDEVECDSPACDGLSIGSS